MQPTNIRWVWSISDGHYHGIFDTKEEALQNALSFLLPGENVDIKLGHAEWPNPTDCDVAADVYGYYMDVIDESAVNLGFGFHEDPIFVVPSKEKAIAALKVALDKWALDYIAPACFRMGAVIETYQHRGF